MKLGSKHIKILGALAAIWLGVFAVSDASASSLDGASSTKTFKLNYFDKKSSWMPSALSPTGSQDALVMGVLSLPGAVTWADYETWGQQNARWSGVGEYLTAYKGVTDATLRMLKRITTEPELRGLLNGLQSENVLGDAAAADVGARLRENVAMIRVVNKTPDKPAPKDGPVIDNDVALPKDDEPPCASRC
jgi:hypothetical protein